MRARHQSVMNDHYVSILPCVRPTNKIGQYRRRVGGFALKQSKKTLVIEYQLSQQAMQYEKLFVVIYRYLPLFDQSQRAGHPSAEAASMCPQLCPAFDLRGRADVPAQS